MKPSSDWGPATQKHKKIFFQNIETTIPLNPQPEPQYPIPDNATYATALSEKS